MEDNRIKFDEAIKKQNEFLNNLNIIKIGKKTDNQKEVINNLENFYISREEVINFLETMEKRFLMHPTNQNKIKLGEKALKY